MDNPPHQPRIHSRATAAASSAGAAFILATGLGLAACASGSDAAATTTTAGVQATTVTSPSTTTPVPTTATAADPVTTTVVETTTTSVPTAETDGTWFVEGYGYIVNIEGSEVVDTYIPIGDWCMPGEFLPLDGLEMTGADAAVVSPQPGITSYRLSRTTVPASCDEFDFDAEPAHTMEAFIELMDLRYPFFAERDFDWDEAKPGLRTVGESATTVEEVGAAIAETFWAIGDGHNGVNVPSEPPANLLGEWRDREKALNAARAEVNDRLGDSYTSTPTDVLTWGSLSDDIGYLNIDRLAAVADEDDEVADFAAYQDLLDEALTALADKDSLILDLRFNGGGSDRYSIETASRFTTESVDVFTKESYSAPELSFTTVTVDPSDSVRFDGDVAALVSPATASAAEILGVTMGELGATIIGPRSEGIMSDAIPWYLPGDLEMQMSMEVYRDLDGQTYEVRGVPIDITTTIAETLDAAIASF